MAGGILLAAVAIRVWAAGSDLWLDEVWSLSLAKQLSSSFDVISSLHETNNHVLNTLWLAFLGDDGFAESAERRDMYPTMWNLLELERVLRRPQRRRAP